MANATFLAENAARYESKDLESFSNVQSETAGKLDDGQWNGMRKSIQNDNNARQSQQGSR
jgi:hypothetical protein